jgi:hypothetical protein
VWLVALGCINCLSLVGVSLGGQKGFSNGGAASHFCDPLRPEMARGPPRLRRRHGTAMSLTTSTPTALKCELLRPTGTTSSAPVPSMPLSRLDGVWSAPAPT